MQHPADSSLTASPTTAAAVERVCNSPSRSPEPPGRRRPKRPGAGGRKTETTRKNGNGKNITLEDLRAHFRLSLGEAAQRLGVCASTLKRVCRRKGIPAWPQRKLVKLSRAVDQVSAAHKGLSPSGGLVPEDALGTHPDDACYASHLASAYYNGFEDEGADSDHPNADLPPAAPLDIAHLPPGGGYEQLSAAAAQPDPGWSPFEYNDNSFLRRLPPRLSDNHSHLTASHSADLGHLSRLEGRSSHLPDFAAAGSQRTSSLRAIDRKAGLQPQLVSRHPPPLSLAGRSHSYNMAPRHLSTGSLHSEHCSWHPSHPTSSAKARITTASQHSPNGPYLPPVLRQAATLPSSLSLPELQVNRPTAELQPRKHRPQHSSSSGEEAAFCTETLGASHYARFYHPPLLAAKATAGFGSRQHAGTDEYLTTMQHLASSRAGEFGEVPTRHTERVINTAAFNTSSAFQSSALQNSPFSDPAFRNTIAGSLGGVGPGFAGGSGSGSGFGSPPYGPPGYTSSGYHGMQLSAVCSDIARQLASWRASPHPFGIDSNHADATSDHGGGPYHNAADFKFARTNSGSGPGFNSKYRDSHSFLGAAVAATTAAVAAINQDRAQHDGGDACQGAEQALHSPTVAAAFVSCTSPASGELSHDAGLPPGPADALW